MTQDEKWHMRYLGVIGFRANVNFRITSLILSVKRKPPFPVSSDIHQTSGNRTFPGLFTTKLAKIRHSCNSIKKNCT